VRGAAGRDARLCVGEQVLHRMDLLSQAIEPGLDRPMSLLQLLQLRALATQRLLALDDALVMILVAADAQPVVPDPDTVTRDHGVPRLEPCPQRQRLRQIVCGHDVAEQPVETRRAADMLAQTAGDGAPRRAPGGGREKAHAALVEPAEYPRNVVDRIDADGLEIRAEHGLDRTLPAGVDIELLGETRPAGKPARRQPLDHLPPRLPERRALQRLERDDPPLGRQSLAPRRLHGLGELPLALPFGLQLRYELLHPPPLIVRGGARRLLVRFGRGDARGHVGGRKPLELAGRALLLCEHAANVVFQFLDPDTLRLGACRAGAQRLIERLPAVLPVVRGLIGGGERRRGGLLCGPRRRKSRAQLGERGGQLRCLLRIAPALQDCFLERLDELLELLTLPGAQLPGMLDRLFGARDFCTDLVVASLHRRQLVGLPGVFGARPLDRCFERALLRERGLKQEIALAHDRCARSGLGLDLA
jgi:hypothetical protein